MEFKRGDVVRLRSGGQWMTVIFAPHDPNAMALVRCVWMDSAGNVTDYGFPPETLISQPEEAEMVDRAIERMEPKPRIMERLAKKIRAARIR